MGSKAVQSNLWGQRPQDWADIQEATGMSGYEFVLDIPEVKSAKQLLDIGCGSGMFCGMAHNAGIAVTGIDATDKLIDEAQLRHPGCSFSEAEMESLPYDDATFDVVCGFNSFQYAANVNNALAEAKRVLKPGGTLTVMIWGRREECEAAAYLKAVGSMLPPPPPGAPGPFALSEPDVLKNLLHDAGYTNTEINDVPAVWEYADEETALRGMLSAGPAARAIENSGFEKVQEAVLAAIQPFVQADGRVILHNTNRIAVAKK